MVPAPVLTSPPDGAVGRLAVMRGRLEVYRWGTHKGLMSLYFEELDFRPTPIGALSLRAARRLARPADVSAKDIALMRKPADAAA